MNKMEQRGIISRIRPLVRDIATVVSMKSDGGTPRISGNYRLTLNLRLRKCVATTLEPEDLMKCILDRRQLSKLNPLRHTCRSHHQHNPSH